MRTLKHKYGNNVHISEDPLLRGVLAQLCSPKTFQPQINSMTQLLYTHLMNWAMSRELDIESVHVPTRMTESHPESLLHTERISPHQKAVVINLARAGTFPSHICYEQLHWVLPYTEIRQDHIFASRLTNTQEQVTGTQIGGAKIGGDVHGSVVFIPDPMGATGNTLVSTIEYYKKNLKGSAKKYIALHLIVTPEYLKNVITNHPDVAIYALRVDRGMSSTEIQKLPPGECWEQERGLNSKDYIVPGAGGFGEIMNNSFV